MAWKSEARIADKSHTIKEEKKDQVSEGALSNYGLTQKELIGRWK